MSSTYKDFAVLSSLAYPNIRIRYQDQKTPVTKDYKPCFPYSLDGERDLELTEFRNVGTLGKSHIAHRQYHRRFYPYKNQHMWWSRPFDGYPLHTKDFPYLAGVRTLPKVCEHFINGNEDNKINITTILIVLLAIYLFYTTQ